MRISYSSYRSYIECPSKWHQDGIHALKTDKPSEYFALYGKVVQLFFERYCNDYLSRGKTVEDSKVRGMLSSLWEYTLKNSFVIWTDPWCKNSQQQLLEMAYTDVMGNLKAFDFWPQCVSEVGISIKLKNSGDELYGRLDFIRKTPDGRVEILDGKGTDKPEENVDKEQLLFYALLYLLKNKRPPDKIGFIYWKFRTIAYIDFELRDILEFKDKLALVKTAMKADKDFIAKPKLSKHCRWCPYKTGCDPRAEKSGIYKKKGPEQPSQ